MSYFTTTFCCGILMILLAGCSQSSPPQIETAIPDAFGLHFDRRYLDSISIGPPYSARTQRQMAIYVQLTRWNSLKSPYHHVDGGSNDSTVEFVGGKRKAFATRAAHLADIRRKIDSLKVLERIPLNP
jgi:hypothetical protein